MVLMSAVCLSVLRRHSEWNENNVDVVVCWNETIDNDLDVLLYLCHSVIVNSSSNLQYYCNTNCFRFHCLTDNDDSGVQQTLGLP